MPGLFTHADYFKYVPLLDLQTCTSNPIPRYIHPSLALSVGIADNNPKLLTRTSLASNSDLARCDVQRTLKLLSELQERKQKMATNVYDIVTKQAAVMAKEEQQYLDGTYLKIAAEANQARIAGTPCWMIPPLPSSSSSSSSFPGRCICASGVTYVYTCLTLDF